MWDLRSPTRDRTPVPCTGKWIPEHWTTKEGPESYFCRIKNSGLTAVPLLYISEKTKTLIWKQTLHTHTHTHTRILWLLLLSRFSRVRLCATPQTAAHQAPPSLRFSRQEHWSGLPFPSPKKKSFFVSFPSMKKDKGLPFQHGWTWRALC